MRNMDDLEQFTDGYLDCAVWAGIIEPEDGYDGPDPTVDDLSDDAVQRLSIDAAYFWYDNRTLLAGRDLTRAGQEFWLSRNGHGTGFCDGDYLGRTGDALHNAAKVYGPAYLTWNEDETYLEILETN